MTEKPERIARPQARRIALAAQGFADPRPTGRVDKRHIRKAIDRMGLIQVDSVNVLVRSEELPLFARLGPHPRHLLREMDRAGELFEYWVHEASLLPVHQEPLFRWKKAAALKGDDPTVWRGVAEFHKTNQALTESVLAEIDARGPIKPSELSMAGGKNRDGWGWHWDNAKRAVENLFWCGRVAAAERSSGFERAYDLPERCFPADVRAQKTPTKDEALRALVSIAMRAHGIGTVKCIADYHRLKTATVRPILEEMVELGDVVRASVEGWSDSLFVDADAKRPRRIAARALLSPFDPVVWERTRTEKLFDFYYRIEIYVPKDKRTYGYYVLPFLLGDEIVGRVDLKADRASGTLLVQASWGELGIDETVVAGELAEELTLMASWLELDQVKVIRKGNLAAALAKQIASPRSTR